MPNQRQALAGIDFDVDLIHQFVKLGVVLERVVLRSIGAVPGVEVIGRVEQGLNDGAVAARFPLLETAGAHKEVERGGKVGTVIVEPQR